MVRSLPLRNGFFAPPQITPSEETELLAWGRGLVPELFHADAEWTIVHEKKGIHVREDRQKGGLTYSIRAVATVKAALDDIMELFVSASTLEFRTLMNMLHRDHFADAAVLFHKEQNDAENLAIKWLALRGKKSSLNPMIQYVDFCVLEYAGVIGQDIIGGDANHPLGVVLYESIEQLECPSLWDSHHLERGSISKCGYLFRPREDGIVEAHFVCSVRQPPNQRSKRRLNRAILLNWAEAIGLVEESIGRKRIGRELTMRRSPNWVNDKDRHCCHLCMKTFSSTRRKHHCRACGEIICRNCSLYKSVDLETVGITTLRVCKACMDGAKSSVASTSTKDTTMTNGSVASVHSGDLPLPTSVSDERLRDAVEEYALALPGQQVSTVPDLVGIAWLRQIVQRDPSKKEMVMELMERIRLEEQERNAAANAEQSNQVDIYDTLCDLAAQTLACKFAVVSLIDENRQWFKSAVNVKESQVPRDFSFCEYPVRDRKPLVVMDTTQDPRFVNNPFVSGPLGVRFLAGAPLFTVDNECVGAVCVMDTEPRFTLQENQVATMQNLAHLAMVMVQERRDAQAKFAQTATSSQLVPAKRHHQLPGGYPGSEYGSSDLVPLAYNNKASSSSALVAQSSKPRANEDPMLKEQMIQLLQKASQVRDQVSINAQHAGLNSSAE